MRTRIELLAGPGEPAVSDKSFQAELSEFAKGLRDAKIDYSQRAMAFDSADALGFPLPIFGILLNPAVLGPLAALLGAWLHARYGRRVRVKIGDIEAEGRNLAEVDALLKRAEEFQKAQASVDQI